MRQTNGQPFLSGKKTENSTTGFYMNYFTLFNRAQVTKRSEQECPQCHNPLGDNHELSRHDNCTLICSQCATVEALQAYAHA